MDKARTFGLWRGLLVSAASALVLVGAVVIRMNGHARYYLGQASLAETNPDVRIRELSRSLAYYYPGSPWTRLACAELAQLGREAEARGERRMALSAFENLRGRLLSLRGLFQPYAKSLDEANEVIARLSAQADARAEAMGAKVTWSEWQWKDRLSHPTDPSVGWVAVALLGFVGFVSGAIVILRRGVDADLRIRARVFWPMLASVGAALAAFFLGLSRA